MTFEQARPIAGSAWHRAEGSGGLFAGRAPGARSGAMRNKAGHPYPKMGELRRVWPLADNIPHELRGHDKARYAHHEAGHAVLLEWLRATPTEAVATAQTGHIRFEVRHTVDEAAEITPLAAAQVGAMLHAGILGELLYCGRPWNGVLIRWDSTDWHRAREILAPHFGPGLAGHGYSQQLALAVLTRRWNRVTEIAGHLIEHGNWKPE